MFTPISNPYIVGNPIKTKKMFYGREDDFEFIRRKLESGTKSYIIVLSGERRSGKTSILFQILNGELGDNFIPILIDMQTMAGLKNEAEFFEKFAQETIKYLDNNFSLENYNFYSDSGSSYRIFSQFLDDIHNAYPDKNKLFLIDEYELIEIKSSEGSLSPNFVPFLSGVLESEKQISFVFTGSRTLEQRGNTFWQNLFGKSLFRNVSFLSEQDTKRLITQPVEGLITYDPQVLETIYRLTAGQPFYTQIVGQNIVDFVNENERTHISLDDLNTIVNEILENPLPQMIYFWNSLPPSQMLMLSLLGEILENPDQLINADEILKQTKKKKLGIELDAHLINTILESLYHFKYVHKAQSSYSFQIDLMRQWIKRDHSIWRVMKEIDIEAVLASERPSDIVSTRESGIRSNGSTMKWLVPLAAAVIILGAAAIWFITSDPENQESGPIANEQPIKTPQTSLPVQTEVKNSDKNIIGQNTREQNVPANISEQKPILTTPARSKPESGTVPIINDANAIQKREETIRARETAQKSMAQEMAMDIFQLATEVETEADEDMNAGNYPDAEIKYAEATDLYVKSINQSNSKENEAREQLLRLAEETQLVIKSMQPEHRTLKVYKQAEILRTEGETYADAREFTLAINNFNRAKELYNSAIDQRIADKQAIETAIKEYRTAIETKNINQSPCILASYKSELDEEWGPFFKVAENIKLNLTMHKIEFIENAASVRVDGLLSYSGAGGSGIVNNWSITLIEAENTWLISKISEAK